MTQGVSVRRQLAAKRIVTGAVVALAGQLASSRSGWQAGDMPAEPLGRIGPMAIAWACA